jgi:hypothetical protein
MYPENPELSSVVKSQSHVVALIISDITNPFFSEIIPAIEERLGIEGFVVLVGNSSEDRKREERYWQRSGNFRPGYPSCGVSKSDRTSASLDLTMFQSKLNRP